MLVKLKRGLDLPIAGAPKQVIHNAPPLRTVALLGADYLDLKDSLTVDEGERVRLGQTLFKDRRHTEIHYTAPGAGYVRNITRGAKRRLTSIVLDLEGDDAELFPAHGERDLENLSIETTREILLRSGLWPAFRARPYGRVPPPSELPRMLFITAIDTNPLAADPAVVIAQHLEDFYNGIAVVSRLAIDRTFLCKAPAMKLSAAAAKGFVTVEFEGPHPAGLPGTHIHHLVDDRDSPVWHIGYQDVIAIGKLFLTGRIWPERIVALGGPGLATPRLVRARIGANLNELLSGENVTDCRVISGSVLSGRRATHTTTYLGRYHQQVSVVPEAANHDATPGILSKLMGRDHRSRPTDTAANGLPCGMLPLEVFERVWPLDIPPAPLLRALLVRDIDTAQALGCLALDEEDLALCSYTCPAKYDYGSALRATLRAIERSTG